jgi:hypothetical protein
VVTGTGIKGAGLPIDYEEGLLEDQCAFFNSLWHYASGLSLYWVTGNMMNLLFQFAVNRRKAGKEMRALAVARGPK